MFVAVHTLKLYARHWKRFVLFVLLTALLCTATGLLGSVLLQREQVVDPLTLMVVDRDNTMESRMFYGLLTSSDMYEGMVRFERVEEERATQALKTGEATAVVILPEGFVQSILDGDNMSPQVLYSPAAPLKTQLINTFAEAFVEMLKSAQTGVYTALSYADTHGNTLQYNAVYLSSNMTFLNLVGAREDLFVPQVVSATGQVGVFAYYLIHILVFLLCLSPILLLDILQPTFHPHVLRGLSRAGTGALRTGGGSLAGTFLLYGMAAGAGLLLFYQMSVRLEAFPAPTALLAVSLLTVLLALSAFVLLFSLLFHGTVGGGIFLSVLGTASLFLAGGIIPFAYLAPWIRTAGRFTFHYWATQLLTAGLAGNFDLVSLGMVMGYGLAFFAAALFLVRRMQQGGVRG